MKSIFFKSFLGSGCFLLLGIILIGIGFFGEPIAIYMSKPLNSSSWTTSGSMINAFKFLPLILGVISIVLSLIIATMTFNNWQKFSE